MRNTPVAPQDGATAWPRVAAEAVMRRAAENIRKPYRKVNNFASGRSPVLKRRTGTPHFIKYVGDGRTCRRADGGSRNRPAHIAGAARTDYTPPTAGRVKDNEREARLSSASAQVLSSACTRWLPSKCRHNARASAYRRLACVT